MLRFLSSVVPHDGIAYAVKALLLMTLQFPKSVVADDGDDFTNNLFSDLSPLLALFGERVTMQFMSESVGWADNIILAMAPVGIITAIVGAIRVGGPSLLKGIIGRARENLAVAELELMSSTSNEVCELWNGRELVRCMGSTPVTQFTCLIPNAINDSTEVEVISFEEAKELYLEEIDRTFKFFLPWRRTNDDEETHTVKRPSKLSCPSRIIVLHDEKSSAAPNISINCHRQSTRWKTRAVATFGTLLQVGVLVYAGFATHHSKLRFLKDGNLITGYPFPCTIAGTVILVLGMMLCAHVVENSTVEHTYRAAEGVEIRIVWLQQKRTVSDQAFESCALYPQSHRQWITTSRRRETKKANSTTVNSSITRWMQRVEQRSYSVRELKAVSGTLVALGGFVLQFMGLRGMHWSVSLAQLAAVVAMTCLRAYIRLGLSEPPRSEPLTTGFELDWFAKTLGRPRQAQCFGAGNRNQGIDGERNAEIKWNMKVSATKESQTNGTASLARDSRYAANAQMVLETRKQLSRLADWCGPTSAEAVSLARAMELTLNALVKSSPIKFQNFETDTVNSVGDRLPAPTPTPKPHAAPTSKSMPTSTLSVTPSHPHAHSDVSSHQKEDFIWELEAHFDGLDAQPIQFRLQRQGGLWRACADEMEAALSLWVSSVHQSEHRSLRSQASAARQCSPSQKEDDGWLRARGLLAKQSLKSVGPCNEALLRDLRWWRPKDAATILKVEKHNEGAIEVEAHRVIGYGWKTETNDVGPIRFKYEEVGFRPGSDPIEAVSNDSEFLAVESHDTLQSLYAQSLFSAFVWVIAKALEKPIPEAIDETQAEKKVAGVILQDGILSKLAHGIQATGLGSLDQVYWSLIPPLSLEQKLPSADRFLEGHLRKLELQEASRNWEVMPWYLRDVFKVTRTYPHGSFIATKGVAILMEYHRAATLALNSEQTLRDDRHGFNLGSDDMRFIRHVVERDLRGTDSRIISSLMRLYEEVDMGWEYPLPLQVSDRQSEDFPEAFNITSLHRASFRSAPAQERKEASRLESALLFHEARSRDILERTPLHYAAGTWHDLVRLLKQRGADVNVQDILKCTPLHYACWFGRSSIAQYLLEAGAKIDARSRSGATPLHCAAVRGHDTIVKLLIESGSTIEILDNSGETPLHLAVSEGHAATVRRLLQYTNRGLRDRFGRSALQMATAGGHQRILEILSTNLKEEAKLKDRSGRTLLSLASCSGSRPLVAWLLRQNAQVMSKDGMAWTPLHWAARWGYTGVVRLLLEKGAQLEATTDDGRTALHLASMGGCTAVVQLLLKSGAQIEATDRDAWTPLYWAVSRSHEDVVLQLLSNGADIDLGDGYRFPESDESITDLLIWRRLPTSF